MLLLKSGIYIIALAVLLIAALFSALYLTVTTQQILSLNASLSLILPPEWREIVAANKGDAVEIERASRAAVGTDASDQAERTGIVFYANEADGEGGHLGIAVPYGFESYYFNLDTGCWRLLDHLAFSKSDLGWWGLHFRACR